VKRFEVFACLGEADCARLCRVAAGIAVNPGEVIVHAGDPRALYGVVE
jgi:hypothetical protein